MREASCISLARNKRETAYIGCNSEIIEMAIKEWPGVLEKGAKIKTQKAFLNMAKDAIGTI